MKIKNCHLPVVPSPFGCSPLCYRVTGASRSADQPKEKDNKGRWWMVAQLHTNAHKVCLFPRIAWMLFWIQRCLMGLSRTIFLWNWISNPAFFFVCILSWIIFEHILCAWQCKCWGFVLYCFSLANNIKETKKNCMKKKKTLSIEVTMSSEEVTHCKWDDVHHPCPSFHYYSIKHLTDQYYLEFPYKSSWMICYMKVFNKCGANLSVVWLVAVSLAFIEQNPIYFLYTKPKVDLAH